jgi:hypothetical protein
MLTGRLVVVLSVVVGQLWALGVGVDEWMQGHTSTAWWCTGFEGLSFVNALAAWRFSPSDHRPEESGDLGDCSPAPTLDV